MQYGIGKIRQQVASEPMLVPASFSNTCNINGYSMPSNKTYIIFLLSAVTIWAACKTQLKLKEEEKIFHAGPAVSGLGGIYFGLYKDNKYEFCDGDFMDNGCYTGNYGLSGDTIILYELKEESGMPTNRFIIRRYQDMDSVYWQWKYPDHKNDWENMRHTDSAIGSTGDIFPLSQTNEIVYDGYTYFHIRFDELKSKR